MNPVSLTPRQMAVLRFIAGYMQAHGGKCPTRAEITAGAGLKRGGSLGYMLGRLEERGHIRRQHFASRAIEVLTQPTIPCAPDGRPLYAVALPGLKSGA